MAQQRSKVMWSEARMATQGSPADRAGRQEGAPIEVLLNGHVLAWAPCRLLTAVILDNSITALSLRLENWPRLTLARVS